MAISAKGSEHAAPDFSVEGDARRGWLLTVAEATSDAINKNSKDGLSVDVGLGVVTKSGQGMDGKRIPLSRHAAQAELSGAEF